MKAIEDMIEVGRLLFQMRLVEGASGNMSCRDGKTIVITKTGTLLNRLTPKDFVMLRMGEKVKDASSDLIIHEAIYERADYGAVLHCHGIYNVILSLLLDEVVPMDLEGSMFLRKVRVVEGKFGSKELAESVGEAVARDGVVIVRGHGIYSAGKDVWEAFNRACYLEHSCEIIYRLRTVFGSWERG